LDLIYPPLVIAGKTRMGNALDSIQTLAHTESIVVVFFFTDRRNSMALVVITYKGNYRGDYAGKR